MTLAARVVAGILLAAAAALSAPPVLAAASGPDRFKVRRVAPGDVLHMRSEPTRASAPVGAIPHGAAGIVNLGCVQVRGGKVLPDSDAPRGALWCRVRYAGVEGWASGRYLAEE